MADSPAASQSGQLGPQGHPRGLATLFFTEMWERFSYYGMRALLILFLVDKVNGGMGMSGEMAASIYGLYTAGVYLAALFGGWVADRFIGAQQSVWYGGILILVGDFTLAVPRTDAFYVGLCLLVFGTGLLKPNVSAIVGGLYPEGGARRDAGFSIFYMGINLGAFIGPLISSPLAEKNWRYGFAVSGVGMLLGLIQYRLFRRSLGESGAHPGHAEGVRTKDKAILGLIVGGMACIVMLSVLGILHLNPIAISNAAAGVIMGIAVLFFIIAFFFLDLDVTEKKRVGVILVLFLSSAMFWAGFEQAGSSLNLFASRYTERVFGAAQFAATDITNLDGFVSVLRQQEADGRGALSGRLDTATQAALAAYQPGAGADTKLRALLAGDFNHILNGTNIYDTNAFRATELGSEARELAGQELKGDDLRRLNRVLLEDSYPQFLARDEVFSHKGIPAGWFQSLGPLFVIIFSPVFAGLWLWLGRRNWDPSLPVKFGFGLVFLAAGFAVMALASYYVARSGKVLPTWLVLTFLLHTFGELCLSPVGLSSVTKLAPKRLVGQMMGIWFLASSLGNLIAGKIAGRFDPEKLKLDELSGYFLLMVVVAGATAVVIFLLSRPIKRLMSGVK